MTLKILFCKNEIKAKFKTLPKFGDMNTSNIILWQSYGHQNTHPLTSITADDKGNWLSSVQDMTSIPRQPIYQAQALVKAILSHFRWRFDNDNISVMLDAENIKQNKIRSLDYIIKLMVVIVSESKCTVYTVQCYVMCERVNFKKRTWGHRLFPNSGFGAQIPIYTLDHQILIFN